MSLQPYIGRCPTCGNDNTLIDKAIRGATKLAEKIDELEQKLALATVDAEKWRAYEARKQRVISAGMGRNPLRCADLIND